MLWTDSHTWINTQDMVGIEPEIQKVALTEQIRLDGSDGMIRRGMTEAALALTSLMQSFDNLYAMSSGDGITFAHLAAVANTGTGGVFTRQRALLSQIVVHGAYTGYNSVLRQWVAQKILATFYASAVERKMAASDRYSQKLDRIERDLTYRYEGYLMNTGIPIVAVPLPCPGAKLEPNSGTWSSANVSAVAGGIATSAAYDVAITYVGSKYKSQTDQQNSESALSEIVRFTIPDSSRLSISIASLMPPTFTQQGATLQFGGYTRMAAAYWNIWVGAAGGTLYLQGSPIPIGTTSYTLTGAPVLSGYTSHNGQEPNGNMLLGRSLGRG